MSDQKTFFFGACAFTGYPREFRLPESRSHSPPCKTPRKRTSPPPRSKTHCLPGPSVASVTRDEALKNARRIRIETPSLSGSLTLKGGRIDDLTLKNYRTHADPTSPNITLLHPKGSPTPYYAEFGWVSTSLDKSIPLPGTDTLWRSDGDVLTHTKPVTLSWDNGHGLAFRRTISVDQDFLFTITDSVHSTRDAEVTLFPYGLIARGSTPRTEGFYILHEGPLGVLDGTLKEITYQDLREDTSAEHTSTGGWLGITDKYWLTAIDLPQDTESKVRFLYSGQQRDRYQSDFLGQGQTVAPGQSVVFSTDFFAGAKR